METSSPVGLASAAWQAELSEAEEQRLAGMLEFMAADPFVRRFGALSLEMMQLAPGQRVLDVGCGAGVLLPALATGVAPDGIVVGLDHAPGMLARARERVDAAGIGDRVELVEGDAHALPFPDASFAGAHVERVLMHLDDPDLALREMRRVVEPGGWVVAAEPDQRSVRVDHPADPEAMAHMVAWEMTTYRHPGIGLELNRRMAHAGLIERRIEPLVEFSPVYGPAEAEADRHSAAAMVAEGVLSAERAEAVIVYLEGAAARGEYSWTGVVIVAAGRVPSP